MLTLRELALFVAILLPVLPAAADDSVAVIGAGGIELLKSDRIAMREQDLVLSPRQVRTRFVFRNESAEDIRTLVAFVMPDVAADDLLKRGDDGVLAHLSFTVDVDGQRVEPQAEIRARLGGEDVTAKLKHHGITLQERQKFADIVRDANLTLEQIDGLRREGLLHELHPGLPGWDTRIRLYWEQVFPAGKSVEIAHTYVPFLGTDNIPPSALALPSFTDQFCITEAQKSAASEILKKQPSAVRYLDYILSTGANWKGPIGRLSISLETHHAKDVAAACIPGLAAHGPTSRRATMTDVKPQQDIRVLFVLNSQE
ncbi:MAG: DUF4424 family protein [Rhodospirillaceae bacterium]|nr:DUF4424 family protein [Rhodospirillaceae bacterium]